MIEPDERGRFGEYGGQYVPETLIVPLREMEQAYREAQDDPAFDNELQRLFREFSGRPTALTHARRLSEALDGVQVYLKREDLNHTGAHKINNTLGQVLLAQRMGKQRIVAETGAGQHGVATATAAAMLGIPCVVYMGAKDVQRQALNVMRMRLMGAEVRPVESGSRTLKDAINEAIRDWITHVDGTYYLLGSVVGPHPYPWIVRDFQSVIGHEARDQVIDRVGQLPDYCVACVGGGSNAMGLFHPFVEDSAVRLIGVEAAGEGLGRRHSATLAAGRPGVLHGTLSYLLQDDHGQVAEVHSVSAGLDYPGVGPEHSALMESGRASYVSITDEQAIRAVVRLCELEGILPALESAHALAYLDHPQAPFAQGDVVLVCLSGRGDKDIEILQQHGVAQ